MQFLNTAFDIFLTLSGMVMLFKLVQSVKASVPISVTVFGIVILVRPVQLLKAPLPMDAIPSGMVTLVRERQSTKALSPSALTDGKVSATRLSLCAFRIFPSGLGTRYPSYQFFPVTRSGVRPVTVM